jgi:adenosyl cobinamide kinase/adenosyl cobinamide phosphate guanylyltransferase
MADKTIEARIREHYQAESGEWLVEKGHVKEAKLLKEAAEMLEKLRRQLATYERNYYNLLSSTDEKERALNEREKTIAEREARFEDRKASFIRDFEKWV